MINKSIAHQSFAAFEWMQGHCANEAVCYGKNIDLNLSDTGMRQSAPVARIVTDTAFGRYADKCSGGVGAAPIGRTIVKAL